MIAEESEEIKRKLIFFLQQEMNSVIQEKSEKQNQYRAHEK